MGQRIHQDLVEGHSSTGSYSSIHRFLQRLDQSRSLPFRRLEVLPREQAQVDFGVGAPILRPDGKRRRPHVFRVVLSFSRKAYGEVIYPSGSSIDRAAACGLDRTSRAYSSPSGTQAASQGDDSRQDADHNRGPGLSSPFPRIQPSLNIPPPVSDRTSSSTTQHNRSNPCPIQPSAHRGSVCV